MEEFAKVEKLVDITGASYEDVKNALNACNGDMIDAVVYLEKLGKVKMFNSYVDPNATYFTEADAAAAAANAARKAAKKAEHKAKFEKTKSTFGEFIRKAVRFLTHNKITISKNDQEFANIPLLIALIICSISLGFAIICVFLSMMFGYEYSFKGETNLEAANRVLAQAETAAGQVKAEYDKL